MNSADISRIYEELTARYNPISTSTIKSVLKGRLKVKSVKESFGTETYSTPSIGETEDAFKKYNCAIFTAFRGGYTLEENLERNARLKADMEACGMTFRPVNGCYREADWEYPSVEYCYFVYDADEKQSRQFFEKAYLLSAKYNQDCFLYKRAGINRTAFLVATTEAGRNDLHGDIKFAGQLYTNVPDVKAWTDCSDGRFAFQLKGMVLIGTGNKKIRIGEGSIFDIDGYHPDGIVLLYHESQQDLVAAIDAFDCTVPLVQHVFTKDNYSEEYIHDVIFRCLKRMRDQKCKKIGFHCSLTVDDKSKNVASIAYDTIRLWANRFDKKLDWIVIVDIYGDYNKVINNRLNGIEPVE